MINFNFTLDDTDAFNFAKILDDNIREVNERIIFYEVGCRDHIRNDSELQWYKSNLKYIQGMYDTIMKGQTRLKG
jgi:hypothetical protein